MLQIGFHPKIMNFVPNFNFLRIDKSEYTIFLIVNEKQWIFASNKYKVMAHKFILRDFTNIKTPTRLFDIVDNYEQNYPSQNIALAGKQTVLFIYKMR